MLHGYFDDSGSHDESNYFVVAGYIADADQWDRFNLLWQEILGRSGLRQIRMSAFENRFRNPKSEYARIGQREEDILLCQLAAAIRSRVRFAVGGIVPMRGFREHIEGRHETSTGHAYTIAANILLKAIERWERRLARPEPIAFFLEAGTKHSGELIRELKKAAELPEWKKQGWLGQVSCVTKGKVPALEAADLIAYELYKEMVGQGSARTPRLLLELAVKRVPNCVLTTNDEGMAELVRMRVGADDRATLPESS